MSSKSSCNPSNCGCSSPRPVLWASCCAACWLSLAALAHAGDAPQWMHALTSATVPGHDDKTDAVLLYYERTVSVQSADKIRIRVRGAYKILRPGGRDYGTVVVPFNSNRKVNNLHGWCIPAQGKDYEVRDKDGMETAVPKIEGSELVSDVKVKVLRVPASDPGNIVGYEYEVDEHPLVLQDLWIFQELVPVRESHYFLQLPSGWEYKASWLNYSESKPSETAGQSHWVVSNLKALHKEEDMPPMRGVAAQMFVSFFPPGGSGTDGFATWRQMGLWYRNLVARRIEASPDIKQKVAALSASASNPADKMKAIARFVQHDIRYVAIELGIGGWQPHPAPDVFVHHYGDCKDKATLTISMLQEIGVDTYYVVINTERGSVTPKTPPQLGDFDHVIVAIKLPDGAQDSSIVATMQHPNLGRLLFFDPTNELTPFGQIGGYLQANYGLLVTPTGGELVELPTQASAMNGIQRTGRLSLDASGNLQGEIEETRLGDRAWTQRRALSTVTTDVDRIKPIESLLAASLPSFQITKASIINLQHTDQPFGFRYSFVAQSYARNMGDLLLVRPRVIGTKAEGFMETKEPREFPIEFEGPVQDTDRFEITLPPGYGVDELPPPVDLDYGFATYHAKTEVKGNVIDYSRTFEVRQLSVPVSQSEGLKKFYRIISGDERNTVVLKSAGK